MITREQFLEFFRSEQYSEQLSPDDMLEVFLSSLLGSSDINRENLELLCNNYGTVLEEVLNPESEEI